MVDEETGGPSEAAHWRFVRRRGINVFAAHGYSEVRPVLIEDAQVAVAAGAPAPLEIGGGVALRSDPQASIARLHLSRGGDPFARWMLEGMVFDAAPHGALRWHAWQALAGITIGAGDPSADAEAAILLANFASDLKLREAEVAVATIGDPPDLDGYLGTLGEILPLRCNACQVSHDALRFLTCEDEGCRALAASAPPLRDFLGVAALKHHEAVLAILEAAGSAAHDDAKLAFGRGRYQRTVIELRAKDKHGATVAVARGGRRDDLIQRLGGAPTPAFGVSIGIRRAAACMPDEESYAQPVEVFFASRGAGARAWALKTAGGVRSLGFRTDVELRDVSWEEQVRRAEKCRARVVVLAGDKERKKGEVAVRDMRAKEFRRIPEETLITELKRLLR